MNSRFVVTFAALLAVVSFAQQKASYTDAEAASHVGEEATVTGRVFTVSTSGKGTTFLNFGAKFPNHTFGGVIFARDADAVGDVKSYEGKEVSLTGRIELSPDQKPQIVIKRPGQIKLTASVVPSPPAPVTTAPTPPAPKSPVPDVPEPYVSRAEAGKIELAKTWSSPRRDGEMVRKDLARLLGQSGTPGENTVVEVPTILYSGVPFLSPLPAAMKTLNLEGAKFTRVKISTPGLPQDSLTAYCFIGVFAGGFDRLYLITDIRDQVVSVLLVESSSRTRVNNEPDTAGYHTYNFITGSGKAASHFVVRHQVAQADKTTGVVVVDSLLVDPTDPENKSTGVVSKGSRSSGSTRQKTGKVVERLRWIVPGPMVNLILRCVGG